MFLLCVLVWCVFGCGVVFDGLCVGLYDVYEIVVDEV